MTDSGGAVWRGSFACLRHLQGSRHGPKVVGFPVPRHAGSGVRGPGLGVPPVGIVVGPTYLRPDCDVFLSFSWT
jgi:hypothetical protein